MSNEPSIQEWKNLYDAAIEFKRIEPWNWMWDSNVFGVQNPVNGEIGYCCILGRMGEHFALAVYLGVEGLEGYLRIQSGYIRVDDPNALHIQKCLMASFEDRQFLEEPDFQMIKKLGLKFRGRNSWPLFRNYLPGYHPWYLTSDEAKYLTLALHQAIDVSLRFNEDSDMLTPTEENQYLVRVPTREEKGLRWMNEWLEPHHLEKVEIVIAVDDSRTERIKRIASNQNSVWEIDFFYYPTGVRDKKERPYYPYTLLIADHHSYLILTHHLAKPSEYIYEFTERFLRFIENIRSLPGDILVRKEEAFRLLEPITSKLGINLILVDRLPAVEEAKDGLFRFLVNR